MDAARHGRSGGSRDVGELATVTGGRARRLGLNGGGLGGAGWGSKEGVRASSELPMPRAHGNGNTWDFGRGRMTESRIGEAPRGEKSSAEK